MQRALAKAAYTQRIDDERRAAAQVEHDRRAAAEQEREAKGAAYAAWQAEHLAGLVQTSIGPDASAGTYGAGGPWERIYHAERGTPGAWYDTGDTWYQNPAGVLRRDYGNASVWFASQETVDSWVLACDDGSVSYARHVLEYHNYGVFGSDVADRLVELRGLEHYITRARGEEWLVVAGTALSRARDVTAHYGIPQTPIAIRRDPYTFQKQLTAVIGTYQVAIGAKAAGEFWTREWQGVGQAPDGRWFATGDVFNGGAWRLLSAAECAALGLDTTPPAIPPALPEAQPLPSRQAVEDRNERWSAIFGG